MPGKPIAFLGAAHTLTPAGTGTGVLDRPAVGAGADSADGYPPIPINLVPEFDAAEQVGGRGLAAMDRTTLLALAAYRPLLVSVPEDTRHIAVVLGSSTGSISSSTEYSLETLRQEKPYLVRASLFPNSVMNCAASRVAIRHGVHGPNATLSTGSISFITGLKFALNLMRTGRATTAYVGAVEELRPQTAWGWYQRSSGSRRHGVGESAAAVEVTGTPGASTVASVLACLTSGGSAESVPARLRRATITALTRASRDTTAIRATSSCSSLGSMDSIPSGASIDLDPTWGELGSSTAALQLLRLIATWQGGPEETALIRTGDCDGNVGVIVLGGASR